jgi:hypothetical protein
MEDEIKVIDGKIYLYTGDVPSELPKGCTKCEFYDGDETFQNHIGRSCYDTEYYFQCKLNEGDYYHSGKGGCKESVAQGKLFAVCPLKNLSIATSGVLV